MVFDSIVSLEPQIQIKVTKGMKNEWLKSIGVKKLYYDSKYDGLFDGLLDLQKKMIMTSLSFLLLQNTIL
jgi:hypothetical protein